jgi:hypothetical protein
MKEDRDVRPSLEDKSPIPEAVAAIRPRVKAGRAAIERTAAAEGSAVESPAATAGNRDDDGFGGAGRREWRERHRLRWRCCEQAEAESERRGSKQFHGLFLSSDLCDTGGLLSCRLIAPQISAQARERRLNPIG